MKNVLILLLLCIFMGACQKDEEISPLRDEASSYGNDQSEDNSLMYEEAEANASDDKTSSDSSPVVTPKSNMTEYAVNPKFGVPNSTYYDFKVYDPAGSLSLSVKLYEKATGAITYLSMSRIGNYWKTSRKISKNGWYDYRYVYSSNHNNISTRKYTLCNTYNTFSSSSSGINHIFWPFGADGSSFNNRYNWIGSHENNGCGSDWNQNGHCYQSCGADDSYAEDWNKGCTTPNADNGATVRSPLDGIVVNVMTNTSSNNNGGYGNAIDIEQEASNGRTYIFRIAHLKYAPTLSVGEYVRAGVTKIGSVGMSGGTSTAPHAHCALYKINNGCNAKAKFIFNAN